MLTEEHKAYLLQRGYTEELLDQEELHTTGTGNQVTAGVEYYNDGPRIALPCRSMGSLVLGVHTFPSDRKDYRFYKHHKTPHLANYYGSTHDKETLYRTRQLVLTEGIFDRIAIKRCRPDFAVFARLSKGTPVLLQRWLVRYANTVWIAFDNDQPGEKAATIAMEYLMGKTEAIRLRLPMHDPSKSLEKLGLDMCRQIVESQLGLGSGWPA